MMLARTRSVRQKLLLVVLATTFLALSISGIALTIYDIRTYQRTWINDLVTQADIIGQAAAPALAFDDPKAATETLHLLRSKPRVRAGAFYTAKGTLFASYVGTDGDTTTFPALPEPDDARIAGDEVVVFRRIVQGNEILGTAYLRAHYDLASRMRDYLIILFGAMLLGLVAAAVFSSWLNTVVTRPILAVSAVARSVIERRDYGVRAQKTTQDEIGGLVDDFNDMLAEIGRQSDAMAASNQQLEREITERREIEDALRRAQEDLQALNVDLERRVADRTEELQASNKELESFSYSVSHDLRAPVRAMAGFSRLLLKQHAAQLDEEGTRKAEIIHAEANRMGVLIDDLLAFARLGRQAIHATELDMESTARDMFERLHAQHTGARADFRLGTLPRAWADRALMQQVWANLLSNALKFSGQRDQPLVEVNAITDATEHIYFVRDNGAGFNPSYQSKLFGVFQRLHTTAEFPGNGVGLALVHRIITRHGGRIWAESQPDHGATFYFSLPKAHDDGTDRTD